MHYLQIIMCSVGTITTYLIFVEYERFISNYFRDHGCKVVSTNLHHLEMTFQTSSQVCAPWIIVTTTRYVALECMRFESWPMTTNHDNEVLKPLILGLMN